MNTELLLKVKERVLAEPSRVTMTCWWAGTDSGDLRSSSDCGMVGCIGGHSLDIAGIPMPRRREGDEMIRILIGLWDLPNYAVRELCSFHQCQIPSNPYYDLSCVLDDYPSGTREYAEIVAQAIDRCIEINGGKVDPFLAADFSDLETRMLEAQVLVGV